MRRSGSLRSLLAMSVGFAMVGAGALVVTQGLSVGATGNLIDFSGFRYGDEGWSIQATDALDVNRTSPGALDSLYALELKSAQEVDVHIEDQQNLPKTVEGESYLGVLYVKSAAPGVAGVLSIKELNDGSVVAADRTQFSTRTDWSRVVVFHDALTAANDLLVSVDFDDVPGDTPLVMDHLRLLVAPTGGGVPDDPPVEPGKTVTQFGASVDQGQRSWETAVAESDAAYGRLDVLRVFYPGLPSGWPGRAGSIDRPVVVSFKAQPQDILTGVYDSELSQWFDAAPRDRDIWWSYWHEPEDNVGAGDFTAREWREAYRRIAVLAQQAGNPSLHSTVILMCWTANPSSGRSVSDYFPGSDVVETLAWDCYNKSEDSYLEPARMFEKAIAASRERGVGFGVAELGSKLRGEDDGTLRAVWLRQVAAHLADEGAEFVTYFDALMPGGDFRLLDSPSQTAWRDAVAG